MIRKVLLAVSAAVCLAADGGLQGPVSSIVFDRQSHSLRPVIGIPGASYLGAAVVDNADAAAMAPDRGAVVSIAAGVVQMVRNGASKRLAEGVSAEARITWREDSAQVAVLNAGRLAVFTSDGTLDLSLDMPGRVTSLGGGADSIYAAVEAQGVYRAGAEMKLVARAERVGGLFVSGKDVYFTDAVRGEAWRVRDGEPALIAKVDGARGIGVVRDVVVIAAGRRLIGFRQNTWQPVFEIDLEFEPSGIERFDDSSLLIASEGSGPMHVVNVLESAVYFVPRAQEGNVDAQ